MKKMAMEFPEISWINPFKSQLAGFLHSTFYSSSMKRDIGYAIYLPPGYFLDLKDEIREKNIKTQTGKRFPVIYWLHGKGGDESTGFNIRIAAMLDKEIISGGIKPVIMVFPNCGSFSMFCDSYDS
ncbi:MAG: hypothetical protein FJW68_07090, partial [Actinobacteria bacterium]|nr:hypothetical protein [Actinomycetota bacterium]